jgi:hypothetical protein
VRKHPSIAALGALALLAAPTSVVAAEPSEGLRDGYNRIYERVDDLGGEPGRHIVRDGVRKDGRKRDATRAEVIASITTLRGMEASLKAPAAAPAPAGGSTASAGLEAIAACESGGNPAAVSPDGQYRGKYQFDLQTWQSVGGSGDPAAASEAEQDRRAAALMAQRGSSPWPVCGG